MRKRDTVKLVDNGLFNARIRMTQAGDRRTTAGIEIFFAIGIEDKHPLAPVDNGQGRRGVPMKYMIHGTCPLPPEGSSEPGD
jgi:hypothetical protein